MVPCCQASFCSCSHQPWHLPSLFYSCYRVCDSDPQYLASGPGQPPSHCVTSRFLPFFHPNSLWLGESLCNVALISSVPCSCVFSGFLLPTKKKKKKKAISHSLPFRCLDWNPSAEPLLHYFLPVSDLSFRLLVLSNHLKPLSSVPWSSHFCQSSILPPALHFLHSLPSSCKPLSSYPSWRDLLPWVLHRIHLALHGRCQIVEKRRCTWKLVTFRVFF